MRILTSEQIRFIEESSVRNGMTFLRLMENAGSACARIIKENYINLDSTIKKVTVVCGSGKNGGDGFVIARKLYESGCTVNIILAKGEPKDSDSIEMMKKIKLLPVNIIQYNANDKTTYDSLYDTDIIIDSIFGTGFSGETDKSISSIFNHINSSGAKTIAIDMPSGLFCDTGEIVSVCIAADLTIAISALKPVHIFVPSSKRCGRVVVADIGISEKCFSGLKAPVMYTFNEAEVKSVFKPINQDAHKGNFGHLLSVCGSMKMPGAAVIAANAAVFSGVGLITAAFPDAAYPAISAKLTEPLMLPLASNRAGMLSKLSIKDILNVSEKSTAILIGCGLGLSADITQIVNAIVSNAKCPIVLDADGINSICGDLDILYNKNIVLTPHLGEMARLTGLSISQIQENRVDIALEFSRKYGVTLVLKGANTVVAADNSNDVFINSTGNPGLATGGSGDLLAGILASFLAQGMPTGDASTAAVYIHGLIADKALEKSSCRGLTPSTCLYELPVIMGRFETVV